MFLPVKTSAFTLALFAALILSAYSQTRKRPVVKKTTENVPEAVVPSPETKPSPVPAKRNERPGENSPTDTPNTRSNKPQPAQLPYRYEFTQPAFLISQVIIEHNDDGIGTISFKKKGDEETITDPIKVSAKALERINAALTLLNFLESTDNYQYEKDYSHLGNMKFGLTRGGRTREVTYNWTENKDAKAIMTEYRKITNQFVWIFDISLSRENQPLEAPRLFDGLDSMMQRSEISDPDQLVPFLKELSDDERIPLIARNHALKLLKQVEKENQKARP